jgi:hypothetical protein
MVGVAEKIDENQVVDVFRRLQKINRYAMPNTSTINDMNLNKSLVH